MIITKHNNGHDDDDDFINSNKDSIFKQKKIQARWFAILKDGGKKTIPLTEE